MRIRILTVSAVSGIAVLLSACGSKGSAPLSAVTTAAVATTTGAPAAAADASGATTTAGPNGQGGADRRAAVQAYRDCLTTQGLTLPSAPQRQPGQNGQNGQGDPNAQPGDPNGNLAGPLPSDQVGPPPSGQNGQPPVTDANGQPVRGGGGGGFGGGLQSIINDPANKAAVDACASLVPAGGFGGGGPGGNGGRGGQAFQAYLSCLKDNGVDIPTTTAPGPPPSFDRNSPAFAAANEKCQVLLPQRSGNGTTTSTANA